MLTFSHPPTYKIQLKVFILKRIFIYRKIPLPPCPVRYHTIQNECNTRKIMCFHNIPIRATAPLISQLNSTGPLN